MREYYIRIALTAAAIAIILYTIAAMNLAFGYFLGCRDAAKDIKQPPLIVYCFDLATSRGIR